jgi:DNA mismatch repair protein MutS2
MVSVSLVPPPRSTSPAPSVAADETGASIPDLLHPTPVRRIDVAQTKLAINLAFAGGVAGGLFSEALDNAKVAPSTWEPKSFAADLFVSQFVSLCLKVRIDGQDRPVSTTHLVKLLSHPPSDRAVIDHRRAIVAELASTPALRKELEALYVSLVRMRSLVEGAMNLGKWDSNRRQLDILQLVKDVIDRCAEGFLGARSGLSRLAAYGRRLQSDEPYRSLADLLRYDERLATLKLEVGVGADGRIRGFQILSISEDEKNPFVVSPWRRWMAKLELFARGFRFSDGEVMARLIDAVFDGIADELPAFIQLLGDVELYLGTLGFHDAAREAGLAVCLPELVSPEDGRDLRGLFNPLLLAHGIKPVPCDLSTDSHATTTLVTGPNSGGKTRLLQSIGLTQLLAQNGLFVPARSGRLALSTGLVVSLIEETKADQSEGRLGTELIRIRALFEQLPPGAMVILDELCSGTNPSEGEEIFELVVQMLARLAPQAFITTHFLVFASRLERERSIANLRFLQVELGAGHRPTYQFVPGVATTSLAAQAASRLGVTRDQLLSLIERNTKKPL